MRIALIAALAAAAALTPIGSALAQQKPANTQRISPNDPAINRPPLAPPERPPLGPPPSTAPPMQRIAPVAPLAQPPTR